MKTMLKVTGLAVFTLLLINCSNKTDQKSCCSIDESSHQAEADVSDESLFLLQSQWENQAGKPRKLSYYKGKPTIAAMIFTHCPSACPRIVADIKNIESELNASGFNKIQYLLISMDPARDNPEKLQRFAEDFRLGENWELIKADQSSTAEIAQVLGVKIKPLSDGGFDHSNHIFLINSKGEIVQQLAGLSADPAEFIAECKKLQ
jgi:protein SCO1/2